MGEQRSIEGEGGPDNRERVKKGEEGPNNLKKFAVYIHISTQCIYENPSAYRGGVGLG